MGLNFGGPTTPQRIASTAAYSALGPAIGAGGFTIATWVNVTSHPASTNRHILNINPFGGQPTNLLASQSGATGFWGFFFGNLLVSTTALTTGVWEHVAVVRSGTTGTAYTNGVAGGTQTGWSQDLTPETTDILGFGCAAGGGNDYDGSVAEFAMWNTALSAERLAALALGFSPLLVRPEALVAYVPMIRGTAQRDQVSGNVFADAAESGGAPTTVAHPRMIYPNPSMTIPVVQPVFPTNYDWLHYTQQTFEPLRRL